MSKALRLQHGARGLGLRMHFADYLLRGGRQHADVYRKARHQLGNEGFLTDAGEMVRLGEVHFEEMPAQALPEWRLAALVRHAAHLRHNLLGEALMESGQEHKARF